MYESVTSFDVTQPTISTPLWLVWTYVGVFGTLILGFLVMIIAKMYRVVVPTNEVHIVQSRKQTVSYGKDQPAGNIYYEWSSWMPWIGVTTITLPVSVFNVDLDNYAAYDKGRVPFQIDIMAFFRISDSNVAAQRVSSFEELTRQLQGILQGAIRSILASSEIEDILESRSTFGNRFTEAVESQLVAWGVMNVKSIELMDIRDANNSQVIANIMEKKKSLIEKESRVAVAENKKQSELAEIEAKQMVKVREQEALEAIGKRTAQKDQQIGIASQISEQQITEQLKVTTQKKMEVVQVERVNAAEIQKKVDLVAAALQKETFVIKAEGDKQKAVILAQGDSEKTAIIAEGNFKQAQFVAQGIELEGKAKGEAERAVLMAPVQAQITLAKEIGENPGYQKYLLGVKELEKDQVVGVAQAEAIKEADIKIIANSGDVVGGVNSLSGILSSKGGTQLAAMVEGFIQTEAGKAIVGKMVN